MEAGKGMNLPSHFYGTISHPSNQPIRISTLFMERHGDSLGGSVFLRDSGSGETEWEVELRAIDGETWFDKGWKEFVAFYSIKEHYLLMFNYEGESRFLVTVFDKTSNEISYPVDPRLQILPVKEELEDDDDEPVQVKQRDGSRKGTPHAPPPPPVCGSKYSNLYGKEKLRACERDFKSKHPCFAIELKTSYLFNPFSVHIPIPFWKSNFAKSMNGAGGHALQFQVRLSDQETKLPVLVDRYSNASFSGGRIYGSGWRQFAKDNGLTVGELCVVELLKKEKTLIVYRFK